jgi:Ca2+-binding RTX toxin-like protein
MANFNVTQTTDNGNGDTVGTLSYAIQQANITAGDDTITLNSNVRLTGVMKSSISSNINIVGNGKTISGDTNGNSIVDAGDVRPLFVLSGTVNIDNLTITNGLAQGGSGGGGGAGMGGALFIYDGNVTLSNVALSNNQARGGNGLGSGSGGGFGGYGGYSGSTGSAGSNGTLTGGDGGNGGFGRGGGIGGVASGSGGIGGSGGLGGGGGFGGGGGGGGYGSRPTGFEPGGYGGNGGDGGYGSGGGGGGGYSGGRNGFGPGYGGNGGNGGFGGGNGGFGSRRIGVGGGGAGMGGGIFVRSGTLTLANTTFSNNSATGGIAIAPVSGTGASNGQGLGGALFIMKSTINTNGNNQGLPSTLPIVTALGNPIFIGNSAANNDNTATNNDNVFGTIITVLNTTPTNTLPAAQTVNEDTPLAITGISINDVDGNLATTKLTVGSGVLNVILNGTTISAGGNNSSTITLAGTQSQINATLATLRYQGNLNFNGTDNLTVVSIDSAGSSDTDVVSIAVTAVNDAPIGSPTATLSNTAEDTAIIITTANLLAGFSDVDGNSLSVTNLVATNGNLVNNNNGTYTFNPNANFNGTVTLTYGVTDGSATLAGQTRSFIVTPVNDAPIGSPTGILPNVAEDTAITITAANLLAGFSDPDGSPLSIVNLAATNGNLINNNDDTYTFNPNANFNGAVTLTYGVTDGIAILAGQTRSFNVTPVNDAPTGSPTFTLPNIDEDTIIIISDVSLLSGFSDVDLNTTLSVTNLVANNGNLVNNNNGTYTFSPNANFNGVVTFTYGVTDGIATLVGQTRSFTVVPVNDAPIGSPTAILPNIAEDTAVNITAASLLAGFSDPDGNLLSVTNLVATNGSLVNNNNGTYTFNPNANFNGAVTLTYGVTDGTVTLAGQTRSFTVTPVNDAPIGSPTAILSSTAEDTAITITATNLLAGFSDPDGDILTVTNLVATNGSLVNNNNGTYAFNPNANFNGVVNLTYGVTDGSATLAGQTNKFTVTPVNDAPILQQPIIDQQASQNQAFTFTIPSNSFIDVDAGDTLTYSATQENGSSLPSWLVFNTTTRIFSGTPTQANAGILSLKVTATDNAGAKASDVFIISVGGGDIIGTEQADTLIGTNGNDNIIGLGGNDTIDGKEGNDTINGGAGNDSLNGAEGDDTFLVFGAYEGNDTYNGGTGNDIIKAQVNGAFIRLAGNFGAINSIEEITADGRINVTVAGDDGDNNLNFSATTLTNVVVDGGNGNDTIVGNAQSNTIRGGAGNDSLDGAAGDDIFLVSGAYEGNDTYNGGTGNDTIKAQVNGAFIRLAGNFGASNSIEEITADGKTSVTVAGDDGDNNLNFTNTILTNVVVDGGNGNDTIVGNAQSNTIRGGAGNDFLDGAAGDDTFLVSGAYEGNDTYNGGTGNDTIKAQVNGAFIRLAGNFDLNNSIEIITADGKNDITIIGDDGNNNLNFSATTLTNVVIDGGNGNDTIFGSSQANTIRGGAGNDFITGGAGVDTFVLNKTSIDTIADFTYGEKLQVSSSEFGGLTAGSLATTQLLVGAGATAATTAAQRFIFNTIDKSLYFDSDGQNGSAAVRIGILAGLPTLNSSNFSIVA